MKICSKCKIEKNLSEFWKDKSKKDGYRCYCKECASLYSKKYYEENKEYLKENHKIWRKENSNYRKEYLKNWRKEHSEYNIKWRENNKEYITIYKKIYIKKNPDKCKEANRKRRANKNNANGSFTENEFKTILKFYNYKCCACGCNLRKTTIHRDHIIPLSKGGNDNIENIQPLCIYCNCSKHTKYKDYKDHWLQNYAI